MDVAYKTKKGFCLSLYAQWLQPATLQIKICL